MQAPQRVARSGGLTPSACIGAPEAKGNLTHGAINEEPIPRAKSAPARTPVLPGSGAGFSHGSRVQQGSSEPFSQADLLCGPLMEDAVEPGWLACGGPHEEN